jgi:hypothetical protein
MDDPDRRTPGTTPTGTHMRIWDLPPERLCRQHLLGEHAELHALWTILTQGRKGFSSHPETLRWKGKLNALSRRHGRLVAEMKRRGYNHRSPLDRRLATGDHTQAQLVDSIEDQIAALRRKACGCDV